MQTLELSAMPDLSDTIESIAAEPKKLKAGDTESETHDLASLIEADAYLKANAAAATAKRGIAFSVFKPGGTA